jgi:large subunit ribosomal protein L13
LPPQGRRWRFCVETMASRIRPAVRYTFTAFPLSPVISQEKAFLFVSIWRSQVNKSTHFAKKGEVQRNWVLIDAEGATLGRLATKAAMILRGKNKPQYTPNVDTGDFVVIINADKVQLTGVKADHKEYWRYSGWLGGLKTESFKEAMEKHPERVVEHAVKGMLPHTTLGRQQGMKLKVYAGPEHPHTAQNPVKIDLEA